MILKKKLVYSYLFFLLRSNLLLSAKTEDGDLEGFF